MKFPLSFKPLVLAAALAVAGVANAADVPASGEFGNTFSAGVVTDVWTFSLPSLSNISGEYGNYSAGLLKANGSFKVTGAWDSFSFQLFKGLQNVALTAVSVPVDSDFTNAFSASGLTAGDYTIKISGITTGKGASYLANLSVTAVPEPESYAMFLAGLGIMGAMARRRRNHV